MSASFPAAMGERGGGAFSLQPDLGLYGQTAAGEIAQPTDLTVSDAPQGGDVATAFPQPLGVVDVAAHQGADETTSAYWLSLYRSQPGYDEDAVATHAAQWTTRVSDPESDAPAVDVNDSSTWPALGPARWETGELVYPEDARGLSVARSADLEVQPGRELVATPVGLLKTVRELTYAPSLADVEAGTHRPFPTDAGMNLPNVDLDRYQTPTVNKTESDLNTGKLAGEIAAAKPDAGIAAVAGAATGITAATVVTLASEAGLWLTGLATGGGALGAGILPFAVGRAIGKWFGQRAELDHVGIENAGARVRYRMIGRIAAVASGVVLGGITGAVTGFFLGGGVGAIAGGITGALAGGAAGYIGYSRGLKAYETIREKRHAIAVRDKAVADHRGNPAKIDEAYIAGMRTSEFVRGTEAYERKKAAEAAVRGPLLRGLGASALVSGGIVGAEVGMGALGVTGGLSLMGGALAVGAGVLFGGALWAGRGMHKLAERTEAWKSQRLAKVARWTARWVVGATVTAIGAGAGFFLAGGIPGAIAGGLVAAAGFTTGQVMRKSELERARLLAEETEAPVVVPRPRPAVEPPAVDRGRGDAAMILRTDDAAND